MVVTVFGMGFVGLTTAVGFAENGIKVYGIDINKERTEIIKKGKIPFFEPGLDKALIRNLDKTFFITEDIEEAIQESDCIYYCVGTPYGKGGQADLSYLYSALESTLEKIKDTKFRVLVTKSTIPPSTTRDKIIPFIESHGYQVGIQIGIANNPEFLREGHCWDDFINADRIVLGVGDQRSENILCQLYRNFDIPIFAVSLNTGEFIKYLSNTLLATLISYSNEMSIIADTIGDINVAKAFRILHMDKRWNGGSMSSYAYPGCGYGGYCLPKDTNAIYSLAKIKGFDAEILKNVICINEKMPDYIAKKIEKGIDKKCCIGILGLSFKPGSDDVRDTPAEKIINRLIKDGYQNILAYDPIAEQEFQTHYKNIEMSIIKQKTRNSTHRIVACSKCGLQQLFPLPSVEEDKEYYDCNLHDRQVTPDFNIDQIYDKFYPQNAYRMQYLKEDVKIDKQWHILDYACGYGFLMELLLKEGYNVDGLEISEKKIEIIRQRSGQSGGG